MIGTLRLYAALAALVAALAGLGYVRHMIGQNALLRAEASELQREVRIAREIAAQAAVARNVAQAEAARQARKAAEYDALRLWIEGHDDDAPTPALLLSALDRLFGRAPR